MTVKASDIAELRRLEALMPPDRESAKHLSVIETMDELFGFIITDARMTGDDEGDTAETLARLAELSPREVRRIATTLKAVGFATASQRLFEIAGKRRHDLRPLQE
jgi:hypothetical protein